MGKGNAFHLVAWLMGIMIALQAANLFTGYHLNSLGLQPRSFSGLIGIFVSPWLHGSIGHLLSNLPPFALLSFIVAAGGISRYLSVSAGVIALGGIFVWIVGRDANHVGASGWIFGLWAFVLGSAWFHRSWKNLFLATLVLFLYGGMVFGFMPRYGVSFESHIAGAVAGWIIAWVAQVKDARIAAK